MVKERQQSAWERSFGDELQNSGGASVTFIWSYDGRYSENAPWDYIASNHDQAPNTLRTFARALFGERILLVSADGERFSDLRQLSRLTRLRSLELRDFPVVDLQPIAELATLEELSLISSHVADLTPIVNLKNLSRLKLVDTDITDLSPLSRMEHLQELVVDTTYVADTSPLFEIKHLRLLVLTSPRLTDEQLQAWQKALPNCAVERYESVE